MTDIKLTKKNVTIKLTQTGRNGVNGTDGEGVPAGGTTNQILAKHSNADNDTEWVDPAAGGAVDSVNGQTGVVVIDKDDIGLSNVNNTSDANKPISSATQSALNSKVDTADLADVATSGDYNDLSNKPTIPSVPVISVNTKTGAVVLNKSDIGLSAVDNTSDVSKPISILTQNALNGKANSDDLATVATTGSYNDLLDQPSVTSVYDAIVPDDYATLSDALAESSNGDSIFIKPGTYTEVGGTFSLADITIHGSGSATTILTLSNNLTLSGNNLTLKEFTIDTNSGKAFTLSGQFNLVEGCYVKNGTIAGFFTSGLYASIIASKFEASSANGRVSIGIRNRVTGNHFIVPHDGSGGIELNQSVSFSGNFVYAFAQVNSGGPLIHTVGEHCTISGNSFFCRLGEAISMDYRCAFTGNAVFQGGGNVVTAIDGDIVSGNTIYLGYQGSGVFMNGTTPGFSAVVTGNNISSVGSAPASQVPQTGQIGVIVGTGQDKAVISGNSFAGFEIGVQISSAAEDSSVISNAFTFCGTGIVNSGTNTIIQDNQGSTNDPLIRSVIAGTNVTVDDTDPFNVIINASGGSGGVNELVGDGTFINAYLPDPDEQPGVWNIDFQGADIATFNASKLLSTDLDASSFSTISDGDTMLYDHLIGWQASPVLSSKANDDEVVHLSGSETVTGAKAFDSTVTLNSGSAIASNTSSGVKIATAASQKLGFWNASPIVQPSAIPDSTGTALSNQSAVNAVLAALRAAGLIAT